MYRPRGGGAKKRLRDDEAQPQAPPPGAEAQKRARDEAPTRAPIRAPPTGAAVGGNAAQKRARNDEAADEAQPPGAEAQKRARNETQPQAPIQVPLPGGDHNPPGPFRRRAIDTARLLHAPVLAALRAEKEEHERASRVLRTRFERIAQGGGSAKKERRGDRILAAMRDTFHNGLGIVWGENQIRVFNAFVFSSLALIYGDEWPDNKARVLAEWGEERECPYTVVSMARRNGKTFSTSGVVVSMLLCIPAVKVAIFSTCKRTSGLMMGAITDMLEAAFERGTHADRQKFTQVSKNMECVIYRGPDKTKRELGCFPGSVRVRNTSFFLLFWLFCARAKRVAALQTRHQSA